MSSSSHLRSSIFVPDSADSDLVGGGRVEVEGTGSGLGGGLGLDFLFCGCANKQY
jgi:hypothetical protein